MTTPIEQRPRVVSEERRHAAFGLSLRIDSRISVPGLGSGVGVAVSELSSRVWLDAGGLRRRWEDISEPPIRVREICVGERLLRAIDFAEPAGYLLWVRDYGRVLISPDGLELLCEPDPTNADWASVVSAQALPLAATLRGLKVMHASGVVLDGMAVLFMGQSGAGKSSLAAALVNAGGRLLSDDAVALELCDGVPIAHAGSVALQLRTAEDERLSPDERDALGRPAGSVEGKRRYLSGEPPAAAPLGCVFLLERSAEEPAVEQLGAVDPFELIASTFNLSVRTPERLQRQLDVVSAIASGGLAHRLRVQPGVDARRLATIVHEHLQREAVPAERVPPGGYPHRESVEL